MFKKIAIFCLLFIFFPFPAHAQTKAQAESVDISAEVPSPVSAEFSYVEFNAQETLADPVNHPILLTVYLLDKDKKPVSDREVKVSSNRGQVDIIEAVSKLSQFKVKAAEVSAMHKDETDKEGKVAFQITSFIPGEAALRIIADNVVELESQKIQFSPLPFPAHLTLTVSIPGTQKEITLLSPRSQEQYLSSLQQESKRLANVGTKVKIPLWIFLLLAALLVGSPLFIFLNFINARKLRKTTREEIQILKKIAAASDVGQLKEAIQNGGFDHDGIFNQNKK